jgi:ubiquinone/menaquinone biosynthesis C-methylase UbiE
LNQNTENTGTAAELNQAVACFNQGRLEDAVRICRKVLAGQPNEVGALNILGGSLARMGKTREAIQAAEQVCRLVPGNAVFYANLSYLHSLAGNYQKAVLVMAHAVISDPQNPVHQAKFARLVDRLEFYQLSEETNAIRQAIGICLARHGIDATPFSTAWHSLLLLTPEFVELAAATGSGSFDEQAQLFDAAEVSGALLDPFFLNGIRSLHAVDVRLERVLTFLRRWFLLRREAYDPARFLPFLCALAEHCLLNEYVFGITPQEKAKVDGLAAEIDPSKQADPDDQARIALALCYRDIDLAAGETGAALEEGRLRQLWENYRSIARATEEQLQAIPSIAPAGDGEQNAVSAAVAGQYEENPYPRWRHLEIPTLSAQQKALGRGREILVAGCGTGHEALNLAAHYPEARVTGIDLSLQSLAYGRRKAVELGIENADLLQCDILRVSALGKQFDLITSRGVLHHMEDPAAGWRQLLTCLKADGLMKIALYSQAARSSVAQCREWIAQQGFEPTADGIRAFRQAVMALEEDNPLRDIMGWSDFYSLSMCRDLVFNVHEHHFTLPQIQSTLDELGLVCVKMRISNPAFKKEYQSMNPADADISDLESLHNYEQHNPQTFRDMYQFWCCRKDSVTAKRPPEWFYTMGS